MDFNTNQIYTINYDMTINDALVLIERNRHRSLIVLKHNRVVGTLSDGDIRRALINDALGITVVSRIMNRNFHYLNSKITGSEKLKYFESNNIFITPIIDNNFNLINVLVKDIPK